MCRDISSQQGSIVSLKWRVIILKFMSNKILHFYCMFGKKWPLKSRPHFSSGESHVWDKRFVFPLRLHIKATLCLQLASLTPTTASWWASPVNPATDTSSLWTTWTPSRRSKRSWWPLCARPPQPVSDRQRTATPLQFNVGHEHKLLNGTSYFVFSLSFCTHEWQHNSR